MFLLAKGYIGLSGNREADSESLFGAEVSSGRWALVYQGSTVSRVQGLRGLGFLKGIYRVPQGGLGVRV